jgi:hypothetical protein
LDAVGLLFGQYFGDSEPRGDRAHRRSGGHHTHAYPDGDGHDDTHSDEHADGDDQRNEHADGDQHRDEHANADADEHVDADRHPDGDSHHYPDSDAYRNPDAYAVPYANRHPYPCGVLYPYQISDAHGYAHVRVCLSDVPCSRADGDTPCIGSRDLPASWLP